MEKFCLHVSGTAQGDASNIDDFHLEGSVAALISSMALAIHKIAELTNLTEGEILAELERIINLAKERA